MKQLKRITSEAGWECVRPLRDVVGSVAGVAGATDTEISIIKFCVSEAITNAVRHAYPAGESGPVEVAVRNEGGELVVTVADRGEERPEAHYRPRGGLGLAFVERLTDGCTFTARSGGTTVEMAFVLSRGTRPSAVGDDPLLIEHRWMSDPATRLT